MNQEILQALLTYIDAKITYELAKREGESLSMHQDVTAGPRSQMERALRELKDAWGADE